jgi:hypothetical protein
VTASASAAAAGGALLGGAGAAQGADVDVLKRVSTVRSSSAASQQKAFTPSTYLLKLLQKHSGGRR